MRKKTGEEEQKQKYTEDTKAERERKKLPSQHMMTWHNLSCVCVSTNSKETAIVEAFGEVT